MSDRRFYIALALIAASVFCLFWIGPGYVFSLLPGPPNTSPSKASIPSRMTISMIFDPRCTRKSRNSNAALRAKTRRRRRPGSGKQTRRRAPPKNGANRGHERGGDGSFPPLVHGNALCRNSLKDSLFHLRVVLGRVDPSARSAVNER